MKIQPTKADRNRAFSLYQSLLAIAVLIFLVSLFTAHFKLAALAWCLMVAGFRFYDYVLERVNPNEQHAHPWYF